MGRRPEGPCRLAIAGNTLDFRGVDADDWCKGTFTLRESTHPRQLSGTITEAPDPDYVGKTIHAIYRFEGDTLIIAGNEPGDPEVPSSFDAPGARQFTFRKQ